MNYLSEKLCELRERFYDRKYKNEAVKLRFALSEAQEKIPVILVCYNNGIYVENMTKQLNKHAIKPIIFDNASQDAETLISLKKLEENGLASVIWVHKNLRHKVGFFPVFYKILPDFFAYSDPDLELSANLSKDFLSILADLTVRYKVFKAGLALSISENTEIISARYRKAKCKPIRYEKTYSVSEWEERFWRMRIEDKTLEIFAAPIDTTFAVYNKKNYHGDFFDGLRVAGAFTAIHLPWFPKLDLMNHKQKSSYLKKNKSSTWV